MPQHGEFHGIAVVGPNSRRIDRPLPSPSPSPWTGSTINHAAICRDPSQNGLEYSVAVEWYQDEERQVVEPNEDDSGSWQVDRVSPGLCTSRIDHLQQHVLLMDRFVFVVPCLRRSVYPRYRAPLLCK